MKVSLRINVTQSDIERGMHSRYNCPLAIAGTRALREQRPELRGRIEVGLRYMNYHDEEGLLAGVMLPPKVMEFRQNFDFPGRGPFGPMEFDITLYGREYR